MGPLVRNTLAYQVGSQGWDCRVVSGQPERPVLLESEGPDAVHPSEGVCEPKLHNSDDFQLSLARAVELNHLCGASDRGFDQKFCAGPFLTMNIEAEPTRSAERNSCRSGVNAPSRY